MIGLSLDKDPAAPKKYAKDNHVAWINGFLGDWDHQTVTNAYGISGIPQIMLIGPDGKIIARKLRGDLIKQAVEKSLSGS